MKYAEFRQVKVHYSDKGKGRVIVLLHGFLESLEIFDDFSDNLSKNFRIISIDLPGHGKTPVIGYTHSMELMAECVKAVMDELGLRKYLLAGHSMGGYVALAFADMFPENISGLCLFHSTAMADTEERKADRERMIEAVKNDHVSFISDLIPKLYASENIEILRDKIECSKKIALATPKEGIIAALRGMKDRYPREIILKNAKFPVHFIIGKKDVILAWENILLLATLPKISSYTVHEYTGHMGFHESPEETLQSLKKFARTCFSRF